MHERKIRWIAALSAASLLAQPLIAFPVEAGASPDARDHCPAPANAVRVPGSLISYALLPVSALSPAAIERQRGANAQIMIELGEEEDRALQMARELTAEDLAVLLANPKMMQKAGDLVLIVVVVVIVGVIVALALAADSGTVMIN